MIFPLFFILTIISAIKVEPFISRGYYMYKQAVTEKSLEERIKEIKHDDSYINLDEISDQYIELVLKSEDKRFYFHPGIDVIATARAMYNNIKVHRFVQGGSTITQQLAKNLCFSFEKKYERKIAELFVAFELEKMLTKDEILELYCNIAYFGENCYGLKEASNHYYNVEPCELSFEQASALVYTLKSPNNYNPNVSNIEHWGRTLIVTKNTANALLI